MDQFIENHTLLQFTQLEIDYLSSSKLFQGGTSGQEPTCQTGDIRDMGSVSESGRSPGGRHGNPLQYSCLENPMDRGA